MTIQSVDAHTLKRWLDSGEAVVVDVREPGEHATANIQGSTLLPLWAVSAQTLPKASGKKLVLHCHSGKRSAAACEKLLAESPDLEIYNLHGGICAWRDAGHACADMGRRVLPLQQQVQLTVGVVLIAASLSAYFIHPSLVLICMAAGVGLSIAGLTGFCGLARLLAIMPWNRA